MKIQRSTLILVIGAFVATTSYSIYQAVIVPRQEKAESESKDLFPWEEDQVKQFKITSPAGTLAFERRTETTPTPWQMLAPTNSLANDASVSFLLNLLVSESSESTVTIARDRLGEFGLANPATTIDVTLADQSTHQLLLGNPDFSGNSLYALVDPNPTAPELTVQVVSNQFQFGVNRDLAEWEYVEPPTDAPSPVPENNPAPQTPAPQTPPQSPLPTPPPAP
jgi:hypothetical protein